jgi:5-methylcytosine-specific restriction endonuclease McrA
MTNRKSITDKIKILSLRYHGQHICPICYDYITVGEEIDWDHRQALIHGGSHDHFNIRMVHRACHKKKTAQDIKANAKVKRIAAGGRKRKGPKMKGGKFPKRDKSKPYKPTPVRQLQDE